VKLSGTASHVTVEVPATGISGVVISADQNDSYTVSASADGSSFPEVGFLRAVPGHGMQRRALFSERLAGARFVRVSPREGDGHYSLGEIGFVVR
jgi:hypothetical protein